MTAYLNVYINFTNQAREALTFYHSVLGGELTTTTFGEAQASENPADADLLMHGQLVTDHGFRIMAADTPSFMEAGPSGGFSLTLNGDDAALLTPLFDQLSNGGTLIERLVLAPWGDTFGMFADKFGVNWMFSIEGSPV